MKNECIKKIGKGNKQVLHVKCTALAAWEYVAHLGVHLREINAWSRDLNTRPLLASLATSLNPFYKKEII